MHIVIRFTKWALTVVVVAAATVILVTAFGARKMADLSPEHRIDMENEFVASMADDTDWAGYLAIEARLAAELKDKIESKERPESLLDRYSSASLTYSGNFGGDWNHSYEMSTPEPQGVAVLLHGLTDSPYSMLSTAQTLVGEGYNVVVPRMPGHGFAVGELRNVQWEDWAAAVRIAVAHAAQLPGGSQSLVLGGYSNGALMAIDYALHCDETDNLACPDRLILMSPAIAVSPLAVMSDMHAVLSWIPYFEKSRWMSILPEIDPFKFTSFPMRAAREIYRLTSRTYKTLQDTSMAEKLPPILTFQSAVDNTVSARAIVSNLYANLPENGSEIVVYDINRSSTALHLMKSRPRDPVEFFQSMAPLKYRATILSNQDQGSAGLDLVDIAAGERNATIMKTEYEWPAGIYSMSHIAVPFRPDDRVYGDGFLYGTDESRIALGAVAPRGEAGVLLLTSDYFLRTRYNPFFEFQARRIRDWLQNL